MTTGRALIIITLALLAMIANTTAAGQEIFHWIDENGVPNFSQEQPVTMAPGDLLVFHSHLMHRSTDNVSEHKRAAMVFHYATAGTVDQSQERWGFTPPNIDWMPVRRT